MITDFGSARIVRQVQEPNADPLTSFAASAVDASAKSSEPSQFTVTASGTALTLTGPAYSLRWAPPEVLDGGELDLASDIWALGWVAWEVSFTALIQFGGGGGGGVNPPISTHYCLRHFRLSPMITYLGNSSGTSKSR